MSEEDKPLTENSESIVAGASGSPAPEFRVGRVVGRSIKILINNFFPFVFLALIVTAPTYIYFTMTALDMVDASANNQMPQFDYTIFVVQAAGWVLYYVLNGALVYGTFMELKGERARFGDSVRRGFSAILPVLGVAILTMIFYLLGAILLIIPGIIVMIMLYVAVPATVVEKTGVMQSLSRSRELTKGRRWRVFGTLLVAGIVIGLVQALATGISSLVMNGGTDVSSIVLNTVFVQYIAGAVAAAYFAVVNAVTYHDLRVAKEGLDTNQLAAVFD
jgi:hypothetical protein